MFIIATNYLIENCSYCFKCAWFLSSIIINNCIIILITLIKSYYFNNRSSLLFWLNCVFHNNYVCMGKIWNITFCPSTVISSCFSREFLRVAQFWLSFVTHIINNLYTQYCGYTRIYGGQHHSPFSHRISLIGYPATGHFIFMFSPATAVILFIGLTYGSPAAG